MSKNLRWTLKALQDKKMIEVQGKFVPVASVTSFGKVKKIDVDKTAESYTTVNIVPLTVNRAWQGRRFKTDRYKQYALAVSLMLPDNIIVPTGLFKIYYEFGMGVTSDFDNPVKPFTDILQAKYKFNDRYIIEANIKKVIVKKGEEYIKFRFENLT